jgi:hypothetical protein
MPHYSVFTAPLFALFSTDFYRDVGRNWRGKAFLYLLLVELLVWLPATYLIGAGLKKFIHDEADNFSKQIPPIKIKDGVANVEGPQPVFIRLGDTPQDFIAIDTTGETTFENTSAQILLTRNKLYVKQEFQTRVHDLKEFGEVSIDGPTVKKFLEEFAGWGPYAMYPLLVFVGYVGVLILSILMSLVGLIINGMLSARLEYGAILAVSMVALTAWFWLSTVRDLAGMGEHMGMTTLIGLGLTVGYIAVGISANRGFTGEDIHLPQGDL